MKKIHETWPKDVRVVLHNRPLEFHKRAKPAAIAAMAAHRQGRFWQYHDKLFEVKKFEDPGLENMAQDLGLNMVQFKADIADPAIAAHVDKQDKACVKVTASGTPAFFVNGRKLSGAKPFEDFKTVIEEELVKAKGEIAKGVSRADIYSHMLSLGKKATGGGSQLDKAVQRFNNEGSPADGPATAAATLVIFSDFQ